MGKQKQEDKVLFHYCNMDVMMKIIRDGQLWMTDISRSSDYNELFLLFPDICYVVEEEYNNNPFVFKYKGLSGVNALKMILGEVSEEINKALSSGRLTSFVVCFSEFGDVLSQWRGYANDGKGCSLGFSLKELQNYCNQNEDQIILKEVEYLNPDKKAVILREEARRLLISIETLRKSAEKAFSEKTIKKEFIEPLMFVLLFHDFEVLILDSLKYKMDFFNEEKEWRLYFKSITKDAETLYASDKELSDWQLQFDKELKVLRGNVAFYVREDCVVSYYPVDLKKISDNAIKRIYLGPKNNSYYLDVELMLKKNGLGTSDVAYSKISYR